MLRCLLQAVFKNVLQVCVQPECNKWRDTQLKQEDKLAPLLKISANLFSAKKSLDRIDARALSMAINLKLAKKKFFLTIKGTIAIVLYFTYDI